MSHSDYLPVLVEKAPHQGSLWLRLQLTQRRLSGLLIQSNKHHRLLSCQRMSMHSLDLNERVQVTIHNKIPSEEKLPRSVDFLVIVYSSSQRTKYPGNNQEQQREHLILLFTDVTTFILILRLSIPFVTGMENTT